MDLRAKLVASGRFITVVPKSMLRLDGDRHSLKLLPVDLPARPWPIAILTLTNRTLSPVAARFIESAREVAKSMGAQLVSARCKDRVS
jgi:DNA-binding transcriptional LysR family regulator